MRVRAGAYPKTLVRAHLCLHVKSGKRARVYKPHQKSVLPPLALVYRLPPKSSSPLASAISPKSSSLASMSTSHAPPNVASPASSSRVLCARRRRPSKLLPIPARNPHADAICAARQDLESTLLGVGFWDINGYLYFMLDIFVSDPATKKIATPGLPRDGYSRYKDPAITHRNPSERHTFAIQNQCPSLVFVLLAPHPPQVDFLPFSSPPKTRILSLRGPKYFLLSNRYLIRDPKKTSLTYSTKSDSFSYFPCSQIRPKYTFSWERWLCYPFASQILDQ